MNSRKQILTMTWRFILKSAQFLVLTSWHILDFLSSMKTRRVKLDLSNCISKALWKLRKILSVMTFSGIEQGYFIFIWDISNDVQYGCWNWWIFWLVDWFFFDGYCFAFSIFCWQIIRNETCVMNLKACAHCASCDTIDKCNELYFMPYKSRE